MSRVQKVMDEASLTKLVSLAHAHWNDRIPAAGKLLNSVLDAWREALHDITYEDAHKAVQALAMTEQFLPRPFVVRKRALAIGGQVKPAPTGASAWSVVQNLARDVNTGSVGLANVHEVVLAAISKMGGLGAIGAATNGDRSYFLDVYKDVLGEWEVRTYGITG
jgi:hypothetical protein